MGNETSSGGTPPAPQGPEEPSYWEMAKQGYEELVNAIIRPPRAQYLEAQLGPNHFIFLGKAFRRTDFDFTNSRGLKVVCSHWEPEERKAEELPCAIYMHGNSSARVEVVPNLGMLLSLGITVVALDFSGSGQSEGDFVSLGFFEKDDLEELMVHLREHRGVSSVALWGRSMGAATALMQAERDPTIAAMILDSPYASLVTLAEEMVQKARDHGLTVPGFVVSLAIRFIRSSVQKKAEFDIHDLTPVSCADKAYAPALFMAGEQDEFVQPSHARAIYEKYAGDCNLVTFEGDHNSVRPLFAFDTAFIFLQQYLQVPPEWLLQADGLSSSAVYGMAPWRLPMSSSSSSSFTGSGSLGYGGSDMLSEDDLLAGGLIGVTEENQLEVQEALFSMLGQDQHYHPHYQENPSSSSPPPHSERTEQKVDGERRGEEDDEDDEKVKREEEQPSSSSPPPPSHLDLHRVQRTHSVSLDEQEKEEWVCALCTLINQPHDAECSMCGSKKV